MNNKKLNYKEKYLIYKEKYNSLLQENADLKLSLDYEITKHEKYVYNLSLEKKKDKDRDFIFVLIMIGCITIFSMIGIILTACGLL